MTDPYGNDIFSRDPHRGVRREARQVPLEVGMVLEDVHSGFVGAVLRVEKSGGMHIVELEDRRGARRAFPMGGGFWLDGEPIVALPPVAGIRRAPSARTNSGSRAVADRRARVARASRIWVEGRHDAELVQHVWGEDLAVEGIAVELLEGADNLEAVLAATSPTPSARAGILLDHLVPGSKESRIAQAVQGRWGDSILILGHPYVDVWQAVKPARVGLTRWPDVPRGTDIKVGSLQALGWPHAEWADIADGWQRILARVRDYRDLEPSLLGRVEELIDFVTAPGTE